MAVANTWRPPPAIRDGGSNWRRRGPYATSPDASWVCPTTTAIVPAPTSGVLTWCGTSSLHRSVVCTPSAGACWRSLASATVATATGATPNSWRRNCATRRLRDLRRQRACATLGYFDDPVLNTFLRLGPLEVTRTVFHEWARQFVLVAGDTRLNESFATAVKNEGLRRWLARQATQEQRAAFVVQRVRRVAFTARRRVSSGLRIGHRVAVRSDRPAQPALTVSRQPPSAVRAAVLRRSAVRRVSASCALRFRAGYARSRGVWPADHPI